MGLTLTILSLGKVLYEGPVLSITSVNEKGKFDVLPMHSRFISVVKDYIIYLEPTGKKIEQKFDIGVMKVKDNKIDIFLGF